MKSTKNKNLIISLIKDDLINYKLVTGLNDLGLDAPDYFLHLSETIFELMGFPQNEEADQVYENYLQLLKKTKSIDITASHQPLDALALEIYVMLNQQKPKTKHTYGNRRK